MSRQVDFFDGAQSSTTPTIGSITASDIITYPDDATYEATESGAPTDGDLYYNTTTDRIRYYDTNESVWRNLLPSDPEDTLLLIKDDTDNTKQFRFEASGITTATVRVMTVPDEDGTLVLEAGTQTLTNKTIVAANNTITTAASGNLTSTELDAALAELQTDIDTRIPSSEKAAANGVATLDATTKIPAAQLPDSIVGAVVYQGTWNASTNTPTLADGTGTQGHYYIVSTAGTQDLGSGNIDFAIGDWAIHNGSTWDKVDNTDPVDTDAVPEGSTNLYYTETRVNANANVTANTAKVSADGSVDTHSDVDTTTAPPSLNDVLEWDGSNWVPGTPSGTLAITTETTTYNSTNADDVILVDSSGGAFTVNLFTAVGNSGKTLKIKKISSDNNAVTIDGNSSETIDGNTTTTVNTDGEILEIVSDGSNWEILNRKTTNEWAAFTPTGTWTTNTTYTGRWRRVGDTMEMDIYLALTGAPNATGLYIDVPFSLSIDTAKTTNTFGSNVGNFYILDSSSGANRKMGIVSPRSGDNTQFLTVPGEAGAPITQAVPFTFASGDNIRFSFKFPVTGWKA